MNAKVSADAVERQLKVLLNSKEIKHAAILSKFLEFIVTETLAGRENLKEYTIGVNALGRPKDFNPQLDATVRIHAGRLRKALQIYYFGEGKNDPVVISIPKGSYIPNFSLVTTNENERPYIDQEHVIESRSIENNYPSEQLKKPILAVLPFNNLSPENFRDYFVVGLGEQLSVDLAKFQNISVISYYYTYKYNTTIDNLNELQKIFGANYVLIGSIRILDDNIRVNIQLVECKSGKILWTESYLRNLSATNVFDIQEEIISEVVNMIADQSGIFNQIQKSHLDSYHGNGTLIVQEAIYHYYLYAVEYDPARYRITIELLRQAIQIDPENVYVAAMLAIIYLNLHLIGVEEDQRLLEEGMRLAKTAVELDDRCQIAQEAMAWGWLLSGDRNKCLDAIEKCLKINPKASYMLAAMGLLYIRLGELEKGLTSLQESARLQPFLPLVAIAGFAYYHFQIGSYRESQHWLKRLYPLQTPFLRLLDLSIQGKLDNKHLELSEQILPLLENRDSIIRRAILDISFRKNVIEGLKRAGLVSKLF